MELRITGRREGPTGANTHFRLSDGRILTRAEIVAMIQRGELPGYEVALINGVLYPKDKPDKRPWDNIDKQPLI